MSEECKHLAGNLRRICEGTVELPLEKINAYRTKWGLPPLDEKPLMTAEQLATLPPRVVRPLGSERPKRASANPTRPPSATSGRNQKHLGDHVETALKALGITEQRVTKWLGRPCGCSGRKKKLNLLHMWAEKKARNLFSNNQQAVEELEELIG